MPEPTSGFPIITLSNGVKTSYWFESESESLWWIIKYPNENTWTGGGLNFQMGDGYITFRGGPQVYSDMCIKQINDRIKALWPELFPVQPPADYPPDLVVLGPLTVEFSDYMSSVVLDHDQYVPVP